MLVDTENFEMLKINAIWGLKYSQNTIKIL